MNFIKNVTGKIPVKLFLRALIFAAGLTGCAAPAGNGGNGPYELVVIHTNDHHGALLADGTTGGLAEQATLIKAVRKENKNVLVLSAGDINTGGVVSNMFDAEPDIKAYNLIGFDAVTLGNHEFDRGPGILEQQMSWSEFPWLSANIKKDGKYFARPYIIKEFDGFRAGVFGLTTNRTAEMTPALMKQKFTFIDEIEAAKEAVRLLKKEKVNLIIALTHMGNIRESEGHTTSLDLAQAVPDIDLIIDGHSHKLFDTLVVKTATPVVSADSYGRYAGKGTITISSGGMTEFSWTPVPVSAAAFKPDPQVEALIAPYARKARESLSEVVTTGSAVFRAGKKESRYAETALGDITADAIVFYVRNSLGGEVDFGLINGGNIRADIPAGKITKADIAAAVPFKNTIFSITLNGGDVVRLFDFIGQINQGNGGWAQVSKEVSYTITYSDPKGGNGKISDLTVNGAPVDPARTYRIATNDFLAQGGDGYVVLTKSTNTWRTEKLMEEALIEYIGTLPSPVDPDKITGGRITVKGGAAAP